jgi:hypothetical protein
MLCMYDISFNSCPAHVCTAAGRVGTMKRPANRGYLRYYRSDIAVAERCVHRLG